MNLAEEISRFVFEYYIKPAVDKGEKRLTVVSGEVHNRMGLKNRMPAVCSVLRGEKLQSTYNVCLIQEIRLPRVQKDSSTNQFVFGIEKF